jgi:small subunit ribosomal protein S18
MSSVTPPDDASGQAPEEQKPIEQAAEPPAEAPQPAPAESAPTQPAATEPASTEPAPARQPSAEGARPRPPEAARRPSESRPRSYGEGRPRSYDRSRSRDGGRGGDRRFRRPKRKVCAFCVDKITHIDYKDYNRLRNFVSDRGKILKRRQTGTCARHQRALSGAIKRARHIALLPFVAE